MSYFLEPRSDGYYDDSDYGGPEPGSGCSDFLEFIFLSPLVFVFSLVMMAGVLLAVIGYGLTEAYKTTTKTVQTGQIDDPFFAQAGVALALVLVMVNGNKPIVVTPGLVLALGFILVYTVLPGVALGLHLLLRILSYLRTHFLNMRSSIRYLAVLGILLGALMLLSSLFSSGSLPPVPAPAPTVTDRLLSPSATQPPPGQAPPLQRPPTQPSSTQTPQPKILTSPARAVSILVDDFSPQPYQGQPVYFFNRLEGDRGAVNNSVMDWGPGLVTTTIAPGASWGGAWLSLNHPIREGLPLNFSAILPAPILPAYQSPITGLTVRLARGTPHALFRLELKHHGDLQWKQEIELAGGAQTVGLPLPPLGNVNELVWVLDRAAAGDYVVLDSLSFTATTSITDTATAAFVWSYGQLLSNWNSATGLIRDKAKDASGGFDAVQATGSLAAATALADQLGVIDHAGALQIVKRISDTLLLDLPRFHGLWPHWVTVSPGGGIQIVDHTEWSSVDTVIAAIGLLTAQSGLGLDTTGTEQALAGMDWNDLATSAGIAHGYTAEGQRIPYAWDVFGGESWLVELAHAGATGRVAPLGYASPPTANGSGFIDELVWLFVQPPAGSDFWGTQWADYRSTASGRQTQYFASHDPQSCLARLGLFGLSAAEVPVPAAVPSDKIYQAFGVGGRFAAANDGTSLLGAPVVAPHYSALIASLHPSAAAYLWDWLIASGYFSPLTNVESLMFPSGSDCDPATASWNSLKGSWNLALQTLGWGRYLVQRQGQTPVLWQAATTNALLHKGYSLLALAAVQSPPTATPTASPVTARTPTSSSWSYAREGESPDESTVGQLLKRSNASGGRVHGQFGTTGAPPWPAKAGYVKYKAIDVPALDQVYLSLRYSKYSAAAVPVLVFLDEEPVPRTVLNLLDQGDWNRFAWTEPIPLGQIGGGVHSLRLATKGQQYGVADLDTFVLVARAAALSSITSAVPTLTAGPVPQSTETPTAAPNSCAGKPYNMWGAPGTYVYRRDNGTRETIFLKPGEPSPELSMITSVELSVTGTEEVTTGLGTFQGTVLSGHSNYRYVNGRFDYFNGTYQRSEWYVCGYGLVKLTSSDSGVRTPGNYPYSSHADYDLVSFTPLATK